MSGCLQNVHLGLSFCDLTSDQFLTCAIVFMVKTCFCLQLMNQK